MLAPPAPAAGFLGNWWTNLMSVPAITVNLPSPCWVSKTATVSRLPLLYKVGCCSRTLLRMSKIPCSTHHWSLCHCPWALSSVSKLGNYKACQPAGCSQIDDRACSCFSSVVLSQDFTGSPAVDSACPLQEARVQSWVGKLRFHMPLQCDQKTKPNQTKKKKK